MTENPQPQGFEIETELSRDLGMPSVLAIGVGTMIAAGIFTLSGLAVGYVGSAAIVAFLMAAVVPPFPARPSTSTSCAPCGRWRRSPDRWEPVLLL